VIGKGFPKPAHKHGEHTICRFMALRLNLCRDFGYIWVEIVDCMLLSLVGVVVADC